MRLIFRGLVLFQSVVLIESASSARVAAVVSTDCVRPDWRSIREVGAGFPASLVTLMHLKTRFPEWQSFLVTDTSKWSVSCHAAFERFQEAYGLRFPNEKIEIASLKIQKGGLLERISSRPGKETDHAKGHWPVEAHMHLLLPEIMWLKGYGHSVVTDPDVFFLDSELALEIPKVQGIGCIAALPAECLSESRSGPGMMKALHDEYRLVTEPELLTKIKERSEKIGFHIKNSTNSGLVIYNNENLAKINWSSWIETLFDVSSLGFYGDQTALSVALGRDDIDVYWLDPKFNVMLTLPKDYIRSTCGPDALYSRVAATHDKPISAVHFVWGPKPWTTMMNDNHLVPNKFAVQADLLYANTYRDFVKSILSPELRLAFFAPHAFDVINNTTPYLKSAHYSACDKNPRPCAPLLSTIENHVSIDRHLLKKQKQLMMMEEEKKSPTTN